MLYFQDFNWIGQTDFWSKNEGEWPRKRNELFYRYRSWSEALAFQLYSNYKVEGVQVDDYINFSSIGLLEALERFDPSYGVSFKTYARSRIRGEVLNNITKFSEKAHSLTARRKLLKQRLGLVQDKQDLNKPLESIVDTILDLALGFLIEDKSSTEQDLRLGGADYDSLEVKAIQANVFILMGQLPPDQKSIMELHYKEHVGFSEIAERLNISKGRVSQLHSQSLESLRRKLKW